MKYNSLENVDDGDGVDVPGWLLDEEEDEDSSTLFAFDALAIAPVITCISYEFKDSCNGFWLSSLFLFQVQEYLSN